MQAIKQDEITAQGGFETAQNDEEEEPGSHSTVKDLGNYDNDQGEEWNSDSNERPQKVSRPQLEAVASDKSHLTGETQELLDTLSKWEIPQLTKRFSERVNHLKANEMTKNDILQRILNM